MSLTAQATEPMTLTVRRAAAIAFSALLAGVRADEHHGVPTLIIHALPDKRTWQEADLEDRITIEVTPEQRAFIDAVLRRKETAR